MSKPHNQSKPDQSASFIIDPLMKQPNLQNESLHPFDSSTNFILLIQKIKEILNSDEETDWTIKLSGINYLRRLFLHEREVFDQCFYGLKLYVKIVNMINSTKSVLAKNGLLLLNEVLNEKSTDEKNQKAKISLIKSVIPELVSKINSNQSFIKNEANSCLDLIIENNNDCETLLDLLQLMKKKKGNEFISLFNYCMKSIENLGKINLLNHEIQFNEIIKIIFGLCLENKDVIHTTKYKIILNKISEMISKEEFEKKLEKLSKKDKEVIKKLMENEKDKKPITKRNDRLTIRTDLHRILMGDKSKNQRKSFITKGGKHPINIYVKTATKMVEKNGKIVESDKENNNSNNAKVEKNEKIVESKNENNSINNSNVNGGVVKISFSQNQSEVA